MNYDEQTAPTMPPPAVKPRHPNLNRDALNVTPRERQVVDCLIEGLRTDEIANRLGLAPGTVLTYIKRIFEHTGTSHRGELVARATGRR